MTSPLLAIRISRRGIGAVTLLDDKLPLLDGRHLTSKTSKAIPAAIRYLGRLLDTAKPRQVIVDAPPSKDSAPGLLLVSIRTLLESRHVPSLLIERSDVLNAYGIRSADNRRVVRELILQFWPEIGNITGKIQPYVADAAAGALYGESRLALSPPPA